jgi:hypothetical protein
VLAVTAAVEQAACRRWPNSTAVHHSGDWRQLYRSEPLVRFLSVHCMSVSGAVMAISRLQIQAHALAELSHTKKPTALDGVATSILLLIHNIH